MIRYDENGNACIEVWISQEDLDHLENPYLKPAYVADKFEEFFQEEYFFDVLRGAIAEIGRLCDICGAPTSYERFSDDEPPEGDRTDCCDRWVCPACLNSKLSMTEGRGLVCVKCYPYLPISEDR